MKPNPLLKCFSVEFRLIAERSWLVQAQALRRKTGPACGWRPFAAGCLAAWAAIAEGTSVARADSAPVPADVFILAGQSNMEGRAHRRDLPADLAASREDILFFHSDRWGPLAPGSSARPAPPDGFGPEISFGRALARRWPGDRRIAILKHAVGGTSLAQDWRVPDGRLLASLIAKAKLAVAELKARGYAPRIRAFVWMQGERDANSLEDAARYQERLRDFIGFVRSALDVPQLPFVIGRCTPRSIPPRPGADLVREAQAGVARTVRGVTLVDTDDLSLFEEHRPDGTPVAVHFDAPSLVTLGERFADAVINLPAGPPVTPGGANPPAGKQE